MIITDDQFGFNNNHNIDLRICALNVVAGKYSRHKTAVYVCYMCSLDTSKAFNQINHCKLFVKLLERGFPHYLIRILHFWYLHEIMQARRNKSISAPCLLTNGSGKVNTGTCSLYSVYE